MKGDPGERLASIETTLNGKGGVLDRLTHLDKCVYSVKRSVWGTAGGVSVIVLLVQYFPLR